MFLHRARSFLLLAVCLEVSSQDVIELTDVRLYTEAGILFGGAVEVSTSNGWERVCYDDFSLDIADFVCHMRGYEEGAMSVRPLDSLGVVVNPTPSLTCQFSTVEGDGGVQCRYSSTCSDHAALICNYPGYQGCYRHTRSAPSIDDIVFTSTNLTVQDCLSYCRHYGYMYAGVAFGQECYCDNQELDESLRIGNKDCYLPCVGDALQNCGGGTAAGIYDSRLGSCNEIYNDVEGAIASPGFPGAYSSNRNCRWTIHVPYAANVTVHVRSIGLYQGDQVKVSNPSMAEYVAFLGGQSISNVQFYTSGRTFDPSLIFTFTGNTMIIDFNSTLTSEGAQGVVLTFYASLGPRTEPTVPPITTPATTIADKPFSVTQYSPTSQSITTEITVTDGHTGSVTNPIVEGVSRTTDVEGVSRTTDVEGAVSSTPRIITMVNEAPLTSPSIAVIIAIAVGIVLILLLLITVSVLLTSFKHKPNHRKHDRAVTNATLRKDKHTDSGIYDPGYETADVEDPIYLSIRNDPRAHELMRTDSSGSYISLDSEGNMKTAPTDHDYQSVRGVSRANTDRSYLSLFTDNNQSVFTLPRQMPSSVESTEPCKIAEDGYMIPTPKNSTQTKLTKL